MTSKKNYSLYLRKRKKGRPIYYAQFRNPDGSWAVAKSTKQTLKSMAEAWCIEYLNKKVKK
jgi:hypothetical protein